MLKNEMCLNSQHDKYIMRRNYLLNTRKPCSQKYLEFLCDYYNIKVLPEYKYRLLYLLNSNKPKGLQIIY